MIFNHGKKTDKETQSPLLKLFTDIMVQKEKRDPEKTNLLNGKHVEKKRKHYAGYRSKSEQKSLESSSSDIQHPYKQQEQELRNAEFHRSASQTLPFEASKSWVFWEEKKVHKKSSKKGEKDSMKSTKKARTNDDTCSCVSCALKKLIGSDYACMGCLALLFSVSVIIACLLVYKCIPTIANTAPKRDSERLKRKIDSINGWGNFMPKSLGLKRNKWQDSGVQELAPVDSDSELSKIIDDTKLNEIQSSVRLRDFYKKLLKADSNIRKLKKSTEYTTFDTNLNFDYNTSPEREKRSIHLFKKPLKLFHYRKHKTNKTKIENDKHKDANLTKIANLRHKRYGNSSGDTIVIEKDQVLIQYKPRIVPKCSHNIPKDAKSHERLQKHPFYKNTQRLDELLDQFNKNLPDIINDEFGLQLRFEDEKSQCKHTKLNAAESKNKMTVREKIKVMDKDKVINREEVTLTNNYKTDYDMFRKMRNGNPNMEGAKTNGYADFDGDAMKRNDITTNNYDLLLTISTIMNQNDKRTTPYQEHNMARIPNIRRLLQTDGEDDDNINYEDLKEVLTDDNQAHDDSDKQSRKKRTDDLNPSNPDPTKYHPPNINNPNWKGPMPLYPDEINSMIKQGPVVVNKAENPVHGEEIKELSDMDYIEDYLDGKYQGLVKLAQAYSDYGEFSGKKSSINEKETNKMTDKRNKMSLSSKDSYGRHKEVSEGIRFEIQPTSTSREDDINFYNFLQRHIKVSNNKYKKPTYIYPTLPVPEIQFRTRRYENLKNKNFVPSSDKYKRSIKITDGSNLHKVPLEYNSNPVSIDLEKEIEKRNKMESQNNKNELAKQENNLKTLTDKVDTLNEKVIIENDNNDDKIVFKKRSLKSFEVINNTEELNVKKTSFDTKNTEENNNSKKKIVKNLSRDNKDFKSEANEEISKENDSFNGTHSSDMDLSDFFMMMSNIFSVLDKGDVATEPYNIKDAKKRQLKKFNSSTQPKRRKVDREKDNFILKSRLQLCKNSTTTDPPELSTTDIIYPMYDSEMIDNIGHRSRVLLSVNSTNGKLSRNEVAEAKKLTINITDSIISNNKNLTKNKTARIVKRHADDNTIFWNDIYDDEYGVKMDVFENIKEKNSATNEFVKRSNEWIQDKVRKISDNFHRSTVSDDVVDGKRVGRSVSNRHNNVNGRYSYFSEENNRLNRKIRNPDENEAKRTDFSALTVHMKDVCRRAATAVREASESEGNKGDKSEAATTGLMQQLVALMTDLIDFQVEQRTCMKLPPDLHNFLEWLTDVTPSDKVDDTPNTKLYANEQPEEINNEKPSDHPFDMPSEREDQDPRSDCLGTLQAIQDLLRSFEDMPENDKSKMTGVKGYLLNQITYLKKRIADEEYSNNLQYQVDPYRYKRDLSKKRRHHKYLKNYSKKHTKTTASYYDRVTFSEPFEVLTRKKIKEKRNLRDIYYKAVADAKKITTIKTHH